MAVLFLEQNGMMKVTGLHCHLSVCYRSVLVGGSPSHSAYPPGGNCHCRRDWCVCPSGVRWRKQGSFMRESAGRAAAKGAVLRKKRRVFHLEADGSNALAFLLREGELMTRERKLRGQAILAGLAFLLSLLPAAAMSPIDASASAFAGGNAVVAQVVAGKVALAVEGEPSIGSSGGLIGVIDLKEDVAGALRNSGGTEALRLRLPCGFKWRTPDAGAITIVWGDSNLAKNITFTQLEHRA